jgi:hypothetical protein
MSGADARGATADARGATADDGGSTVENAATSGIIAIKPKRVRIGW